MKVKIPDDFDSGGPSIDRDEIIAAWAEVGIKVQFESNGDLTLLNVSTPQHFKVIQQFLMDYEDEEIFDEFLRVNPQLKGKIKFKESRNIPRNMIKEALLKEGVTVVVCNNPRGGIEVHKIGCKDVKQSKYDSIYELEVSSKQNVAKEVAKDLNDGLDSPDAYRESDIYVHNCVKTLKEATRSKMYIQGYETGLDFIHDGVKSAQDERVQGMLADILYSGMSEKDQQQFIDGLVDSLSGKKLKGENVIEKTLRRVIKETLLSELIQTDFKLSDFSRSPIKSGEYSAFASDFGWTSWPRSIRVSDGKVTKEFTGKPVYDGSPDNELSHYIYSNPTNQYTFTIFND